MCKRGYFSSLLKSASEAGDSSFAHKTKRGLRYLQIEYHWTFDDSNSYQHHFINASGVSAQTARLQHDIL